jgi:hypothetical protein
MRAAQRHREAMMSISGIRQYPVTILSTYEELFVVFVHDCGMDAVSWLALLSAHVVSSTALFVNISMLPAEESHGMHSQGR